MPAFLVQLRFPGDRSWVTVAVAETRAIAATYGAAAYANATNQRGAHPNQVRIVSEEQLRRAGATDRDIVRGFAPEASGPRAGKE